jgi:putative two-component system response regulator
MVTDNDILNARILIIDDQLLSVRLLTDILQNAGYKNIHSTTDPTKAVSLYCKIRPDIVLLDLNMPIMNGFQVMEKLRTIKNESYLPILIISSVDSNESRYRALETGGKDFIIKPYERVDVLIRIKNMIEVRLLHNQTIDQSRSLEQKVLERTLELYETQKDVIQRMARAIEYRDLETGLHIVRMSQYCNLIAIELGLSRKDCDLISIASPLHDIGKIGIPDIILQKPAKLTEAEWEVMKTHTSIGAELLSDSKSEFLAIAKEIALTHHERWDGTGYPNGLKRSRISIFGRICCLCDVFDALTSVRPYKKAWPIAKAVNEIKTGRGTHFDPEIVDCFLAILSKIRKVKRLNADPKNMNLSNALERF